MEMCTEQKYMVKMIWLKDFFCQSSVNDVAKGIINRGHWIQALCWGVISQYTGQSAGPYGANLPWYPLQMLQLVITHNSS